MKCGGGGFPPQTSTAEAAPTRNNSDFDYSPLSAQCVSLSGQTKQNFGRNTETETRATKKAKISARYTFSGQNRQFRPKFCVSAKQLYDFAFLLQIFPQNLALNMVFQPKSRKPKMKKAKTLKPKPNQNCFGLPTTLSLFSPPLLPPSSLK